MEEVQLVGDKKYFQATKSHPYHSREDLVEKILELDSRIKELADCEAPVLEDNSAVINGLSQEINQVKEELKIIKADIESNNGILASKAAANVNETVTPTVTP